MCDGYGELLECYVFHYLNCNDLGGVRREYFERLLKAMVSSFRLLCGANKSTLQNLFYDGHCIEGVANNAGDCKAANLDLGMAWKRIFRFRASQSDCVDLMRHTRCLVRALDSSGCRTEATTAYNTTAVDFLFVFCQQGFSSSAFHALCDPVVLVTCLVIVLRQWCPRHSLLAF